MDLAARVQHVLDTHHALLHRELPRLDRALADAPHPLGETWAALSDLLALHLMKEERILFPGILARCAGGAGPACGLEGPIAQMRWEHEQITALEHRLRACADQAGVEAGALIALLDDLAVHARTEDEAIFPAALAG